MEVKESELPEAPMPPELARDLDTAVAMLCASLEADDGWEELQAKEGATLHRGRPASATHMLVRVEARVDFPLPAVVALLSSPLRRGQLDKEVSSCERLCTLSDRRTFVEHVQYRAHWPVAGRDMVNAVHWRTLDVNPKHGGAGGPTGPARAVALVAVAADDLGPEPPAGQVRASAVSGSGFLLTEAADGTWTNVAVVVNVDMAGTVPRFLISMMAYNQLAVILNARRLLCQDKANYNTPKTLAYTELDLERIVEAALHEPLSWAAQAFGSPPLSPVTLDA